MKIIIRKIVQIDVELCNGCGECVPNCVEGAIQIVDGKARIVNDSSCDGLGACVGYCPQKALRIIERETDAFDEVATYAPKKAEKKQHEKTVWRPQWPVQLNLVSVEAPSLNNADLLLVADCVPIAYSDFHEILVPGKTVLVGCPKFDDARKYATKLTAILQRNHVKSLTVAHMEVPCCSGLKWIAEKAVEVSNKEIPLHYCVIEVSGEMK